MSKNPADSVCYDWVRCRYFVSQRALFTFPGSDSGVAVAPDNGGEISEVQAHADPAQTLSPVAAFHLVSLVRVFKAASLEINSPQ